MIGSRSNIFAGYKRRSIVIELLRDICYKISSDDRENEQNFNDFLDKFGYTGIRRIYEIKEWYKKFKYKYKESILRYFNIPVSDSVEEDNQKIADLIKLYGLRPNYTILELINWFESTQELMNIPSSTSPQQRSHEERYATYKEIEELMNISSIDGGVRANNLDILQNLKNRSLHRPDFRPHQ